jgi:hypothetical protein
MVYTNLTLGSVFFSTSYIFIFNDDYISNPFF